MRQPGKKDLMRGRRIDGCSNMTTRPHIHLSLSVTSWPNATTVLPQPPYSPDLAPADFFLFPKLESTLKGHRFESIEAIKTNSLAHLRSIPKQLSRNASEH
jgi:transposase